MFRFAKSEQGPRVSTRYCSDKYDGTYPTIGVYDCRERKVWVCKPLRGQALRTSHARLITGCDNATSTVFKDRFLCLWFYTPGTGEGYIHGYPLDWEESHLLVRTDAQWDYDRQKLLPRELVDQINENLERQFRHGQRILEFFLANRPKYSVSLHFIGQRAADSQFYFKRIEAPAP
jgi:hypothetical protein